MTQTTPPGTGAKLCDAAQDAQPDLARRLADAEARLAQHARQQQALSQGMAHDLRAPLRAIDGFASLLEQHAGDSLDATAQDHLARIRDAAQRMVRLLDALQEYSLAGRVALKREPVDLGLLADWVGADLQDADPQRQARIDVMEGLTVEGDEHQLRRMLVHLMDNAWKFSAPRERVDISIRGERVGEYLQLQVRDQGIGFDMQYVGKLFEPFQRLHGTEQGAGPGLGLAIAQCIAQRHGGRIRAESAPDEGSLFVVELPFIEISQAGAHAQTAADDPEEHRNG